MGMLVLVPVKLSDGFRVSHLKSSIIRSIFNHNKRYDVYQIFSIIQLVSGHSFYLFRNLSKMNLKKLYRVKMNESC